MQDVIKFRKLHTAQSPAIILPDGTVVEYGQLSILVEEFSKKIDSDPGPIAILCDGSYRQYVAYLAALNSNCPVLLMSEHQSPDTSNITLKYAYSAKDDDLRQMSGQKVIWHPDLAVLLSTSGSTGSAKWVRLSFDNIAVNAHSIAEYLSLSENDRAPMALPFQYSYGMSIVNSHLATGAAIVLTEGSVVDKSFWDSFEATGCTSLAGVPHSFELMEQAQVGTDHLKHLRYMTQAGGRLSPERIEKWVKRGQQEGWDFFVMYGQTEAAPRISYLPPDMALKTPSAIGIPVPGGEMWVTNEDGEALADGEEGELNYRGPNTMMGYATQDEDLSKPQGTDVLKTGDVARRLPNGAYEIVGRLSRFVKVFGLRISLDEVEKRLAKDGIDAVCVARNDKMHVVVENASQVPVNSVASNMAQWLDIPPSSFKVVTVHTFPRQSSEKIDLRAVELYVEDLEKQSTADGTSTAPTKGGLLSAFHPTCKNTVLDVFHAHFPKDQVSDDASFVALGGDSLSYVSVSLELESVLGELPRDWADMTVVQLQAGARGAKFFVSIDAPTFIRALSIILVVAGHFGFLEYGGGGAFTLLVIAGISLATFTVPQVLKVNTATPIAVLSLRLVFITASYSLLNLLVTGYGELPTFLFMGNWISPEVEGSAWFIDVYLQICVALALAFSIPKVREIVANSPFATSAISALLFTIVAAISDQLIDTHHLYRRLPHILFWMFLVGMAISTAEDWKHRSIITLIFCLGVWQLRGYGNIFNNFISYFTIATLALIWLPSIPTPRFTSRIIRNIAGASLIIYLSHFQFAVISSRIFGDVPAIKWIFAIIGGILAWRVYDIFEQKVKNYIGMFRLQQTNKIEK